MDVCNGDHETTVLLDVYLIELSMVSMRVFAHSEHAPTESYLMRQHLFMDGSFHPVVFIGDARVCSFRSNAEYE